MKNFLLRITSLFVILAMSLGLFVACGQNDIADMLVGHVHEYTRFWTTGENYHYCESICGCDVMKDYGEHVDNGSGVCSICKSFIIPDNGVIYDVSTDGTYAYVLDYVGNTTDVTISSTYKGLPVTSIGPYAFSGGYNLISLEIPNSITNIGNNAFHDCQLLTNINIPNSVISIGDDAFFNCNSLIKVLIPNSVKNIGRSAFYCQRLTVFVEAENQLDGWDKDWRETLPPIGFDKEEFISPVVWDCLNNDVADDGKIYTIENGIKYIIENGEAIVTNQGRSIKVACLPSSINYKNKNYPVTTIVDGAMSWCNLLTKVEMPNSIINVGEMLFPNSLESAIVSTEYISSFSMRSNSLKKVVISGGTRIPDKAFSFFTSLESISISNNVTSIGEQSFEGCTGLSKVSFEDGSKIQSIGRFSFAGCSNLKSIVIPDGVSTIMFGAFYGCDSIKIYCKNPSKPSGWDDNWNNSNRPVVWGYKG